MDEWFCPECATPGAASAAGNVLPVLRQPRPFLWGQAPRPREMASGCLAGLAFSWTPVRGWEGTLGMRLVNGGF